SKLPIFLPILSVLARAFGGCCRIREWAGRPCQKLPLLRQPNSGKLPARLWSKEIAVASADVPCRRDARSAAQHHLSAHELAVVLAQRSIHRMKTRIAQVGATSPHPAVPIPLRGVLVLVLSAVPVLDEIFSRDRHQIPGIKQVSFHQLVFHRGLPLKLRRQPLPRPSRVGVGLVETYLAHRRRRQLLQRPLPMQGKNSPFTLPSVASLSAPIKRSAPAILLHRIPPRRKPELRPAIATINHELCILAARHQPVRQRIRLQPHAMARQLIIKTEPAARVARLPQPALKWPKLKRLPRSLALLLPAFLFPWSLGPLFLVLRLQRICVERMQYVSKQQFLVLLLVVRAQLDPPQSLRLRPLLKEPLHRRIHVLAVAQNLVEPRPRKRRPQSFFRKCGKALVIAVEEPRKIRVEDPVPGQKLPQHERLEKPRGVGQVPLGGGRLSTRLHHHVLRRQRFAQ